MQSDPRPAVFIDRDGTINMEVDYLSKPEDLKLLPGAGEAIARLNAGGFLAIVITNQSGIARGLFDMKQLGRIHQRLRELLQECGAKLDGIYSCPHHPDFDPKPCSCRKPLPGLYEQACVEHAIDLAASFAVGDSPRDLQAATAIGVPGFLVESGKPVSALQREEYDVVEDLAAAVELIFATGR
ncbi:MAG: D-glycero-D-manno-heptose 1,7-bisphosphate phosphatase [Planctomycetota bacterium]|jgi:D-glycero-D-manno-heptose 1,7-bisphosphate phosphatase